jgi:hypothetical protein
MVGVAKSYGILMQLVSITPRLNAIWTHNASGDRHWLQRYHTITTMTALVVWLYLTYDI